MSAITNEQTITQMPPTVLTSSSVYYPESDGKPIAETDVHRKRITDFIQILTIRFEDEEDVYVTGNIMFYYVEGNPKKSISPDVMFVRGVKKGDRRVYKLWEERSPDLIIEFSSRKTWKEDLQKKKQIYEGIGVKEYYVHDPEYDYLSEPILAYRLVDGELVRVEVKDGRIYSEVLGLELVNTDEGLKLYDPKTKSFLLNMEEEHKARLEERKARLEEHKARLEAEATIARLLEENERLKKTSSED